MEILFRLTRMVKETHLTQVSSEAGILERLDLTPFAVSPSSLKSLDLVELPRFKTFGHGCPNGLVLSLALLRPFPFLSHSAFPKRSSALPEEVPFCYAEPLVDLCRWRDAGIMPVSPLQGPLQRGRYLKPAKRVF